MKTFVASILAALVGFLGYQFVTGNGTFEQLVQQPLPPSEQLIDDLRQSEQQLTDVYERAASMKAEQIVDEVVSKLKKIQANYQRLGEHEQLSSQDEQTAQMIVMRSHFLASRMLPEFRPIFEKQAQRVIELRPASDDAAVARVLYFCSCHDLFHEVNRSLLRDLAVEAASYDSPLQGIGLYAVVAHEFWKNGRAKSAEVVLQQGIARYRGNPNKTRLVDQLIAQGHRAPPRPKFTSKQYARMQSALANSMGGSGMSGAASFRS